MIAPSNPLLRKFRTASGPCMIVMTESIKIQRLSFEIALDNNASIAVLPSSASCIEEPFSDGLFSSIRRRIFQFIARSSTIMKNIGSWLLTENLFVTMNTKAGLLSSTPGYSEKHTAGSERVPAVQINEGADISG
jgi:hypothetical protein